MSSRGPFDLPFGQIAGVIASAGIAAILTMAYLVYIGRVLGPAEYGDFAACLSIIYFTGLVLSPLSPAVARLCARFMARGDADSIPALRLRVIVRVGAAAALVALAGVLSSPRIVQALRFRSAVPLVVAFAIVFVLALLSVDRAVVQGRLLFRVHNGNTVLEAVARWVCVFIVFAKTRSAGSAMVSYLAAMVIAELALAVREHGGGAGASVDWTEVRRVMLPLVILMFGVAVMQNVDMLVVKRFFPQAASGAYGAATALARGIGVAFVPLYVIVGPILAGLHESGHRIFATTLRFTALFLLVIVVPMIVIVMWPDTVVGILYGRDFALAAPLLAPLAGVSIVLYVALMIAQALITVEDHRFLSGYSVLAIVQVIALARFHASFRQIFAVLYAVNFAVLLIVVFFFVTNSRVKSQ